MRRSRYRGHRLAAAVAALLPWLAPLPANALDVPAARQEIDRLFTRQYAAQLEPLYRTLHAAPELAFEEVNTAARLATEMRALGFEVTEKVGQTGLVAVFRNGTGPTVMVRTDLDGLPVEEKTGLAYASRARGRYNGADTALMHACGHDIHMTAWVGVARTLVAMKSRWRGTLLFIGQPAEERVRGARAMLDDRLFERFGKPDAGFALHTMPAAHGEVLFRAGAMTANGSSLDVKFTGRGGHGSDPSLTVDPVMMAGRFIVDVQSVVSRERDPMAFGVVTIGAIQGGSAGNIIPDSVQLRGTIRSHEQAVHDKLIAGVQRTANAVAAMAGAAPPEVKVSTGTRAVVNDAALATRTAAILDQAFGPKAVRMPFAWSGGEDYAEFIAAGVPSFFFGLGVHDPARIAAAVAAGQPVPANHAPDFAPVPEPTLRTGVTAMSLAVLGALDSR
jgi:amidohydrolase